MIVLDEKGNIILKKKIYVYLMYKCITFPTVTIKKTFLNPSEEKPVVHEGD